MRLIQEGTNRAGGVIVVGEAPGADEDRIGRPFVGQSGYELDSMLGRSGWNRSSFSLITNVCHERPPGNEVEKFFATKTEAKKAPDGAHWLSKQTALALTALDEPPQLAWIAGRAARAPILRGLLQLQRDIDRLQPSLIIALGNTALWALTGFTGITRWRGSVIEASGGPVDGHGCKLIPTMHPAAVMREYAWSAPTITDLRRAKTESAFPEIRRPVWRFHVPRQVAEVRDWLADHDFVNLPHRVADVENFYETDRTHKGRLICLGFAASELDAMCVPFVHRGAVGDDAHYWQTPEEELEVTLLCRDALTEAPCATSCASAGVTFHNAIHDLQILARNWGVKVPLGDDTMLMQHVAFPGMLGGRIDPITGKVSKKGSSLSLAFCSSMYCDYHRYWKDDGKGWDPEIHDEAQFWAYNCEDTVRTFEVRAKLEEILRRDQLWEPYRFERRLFDPVLEVMFEGTRFDNQRRREFSRQVDRDLELVQAWIDEAVGHPLNVGSTLQMRDLFYDDFKIPPILNRKTKQPTLDDRALAMIATRKPVLRPLVERIQGLRSLGVLKSDFLGVKLGPDGRLRAALNIAGPETMRFSSSANAFGEGLNTQTFPRDE